MFLNEGEGAEREEGWAILQEAIQKLSKVNYHNNKIFIRIIYFDKKTLEKHTFLLKYLDKNIFLNYTIR